MFYLCYLFLFFLLPLRSQNRRMDGSWLCYEQLVGYGVIFNIIWLDSSPRRLVFWEMRKLSQILPKIWRSPLRRLVVTKRAAYENGKTFFRKTDNRPTFWQKICKSLLPISGEAGRTRCTSFISEHRSRYYHSPDGAAVEQTRRCCGEWRNSSHLVWCVWSGFFQFWDSPTLAL